MTDPTQRFSSRVDAYARYRPGYPPTLVPALEKEAALKPGSTIADLGAGTGKSCEPFLLAGYSVVAVEPNAAMRQALDDSLADFPSWRSVDGRAEATGLDDASVDAVFAGQAFPGSSRSDGTGGAGSSSRGPASRLVRATSTVVFERGTRRCCSAHGYAAVRKMRDLTSTRSRVRAPCAPARAPTSRSSRAGAVGRVMSARTRHRPDLSTTHAGRRRRRSFPQNQAAARSSSLRTRALRALDAPH
jgi:hypothetical protein